MRIENVFLGRQQLTKAVQKLINLELSLPDLHSSAGYEALKMKRGAMGSSPSTSGGKKSPQRNEALQWEIRFLHINIIKDDPLLGVETHGDFVEALQRLLGDLNLLRTAGNWGDQHHPWQHQQHCPRHHGHHYPWRNFWILRTMCNHYLVCCLRHDEW